MPVYWWSNSVCAGWHRRLPWRRVTRIALVTSPLLHRPKRAEHPIRLLYAAFLGLMFLLVYGTAGYMLIEHWSLLDSLFMTVISITTVGYEEVHRLDSSGEIFTITVILFGVLGFLYTFAAIVDLLSSSRWRDYRRAKRLENAVASLRDHVIVCGYGRTGKQVVEELKQSEHSYVVIEQNPDPLRNVIRDNEPHVVGDASSDEILLSAGIEHARALVSVVDSDERNVYIVLSARTLNPDLYIVSRSSYPESFAKLQRAGADRVVSPYTLSGSRMAALALQPNVLDALDMVMTGTGTAVRIEEMVVGAAAAANLLAGDLRRSGATLLAVGAPHGDLVVGPGDDQELHHDDLVVAMGTREQLRTLAGTLGPVAPSR
jgi:voltage-gated potassium channel